MRNTRGHLSPEYQCQKFPMPVSRLFLQSVRALPMSLTFPQPAKLGISLGVEHGSRCELDGIVELMHAARQDMRAEVVLGHRSIKCVHHLRRQHRKAAAPRFRRSREQVVGWCGRSSLHRLEERVVEQVKEPVTRKQNIHKTPSAQDAINKLVCDFRLHDYAAAALFLWCVRVVALVNLWAVSAGCR